MLEPHLKNNDNLHRIAISNLDDDEARLRRWWCKKYNQPPKPLNEYTIEELAIEQMEDFYERNPDKAKEFMTTPIEDDNWDGKLDPKVEQEVKKRLDWLNEKEGVSIEKYQNEADKHVTDEQIDEVLANLGKDLPASRRVGEKSPSNTIIDEKEFEDTFG